MDFWEFRAVFADIRRDAPALPAPLAAMRRCAMVSFVAGWCAISCKSGGAPLTVAVTFVNSWRIGAEPLTEAEQTHVKQAALDAMRIAFAGFDVEVAEQPSGGSRIIRVEDTPFGRRLDFGATGVTYPASRTSSVRFDVLANVELAVTQ